MLTRTHLCGMLCADDTHLGQQVPAVNLACHSMHVWILQELTREIQSRQANGFKVVKYTSGVAHDTSASQTPLTNLHFLVLLQKSSV